MGSKNRISKSLAEIINIKISEFNIIKYFEPFVGGANLIEHIKCKKRYGSDSNKYLIAMWKALQSGWKPPESISKELYNHIKDNKDEYPDELVAIAGFCATYNAKWFGGYAGIVTTKIGTQRNYYDEAVRNILKQVKKLENVIFNCVNYLDLDPNKLSNYLIYCDPPYANSTQYKDEFDHENFWGWVRLASANNIVYVSEYNAPNDFKCVWSKDITTTLDKNSRKTDTERLFVWIR